MLYGISKHGHHWFRQWFVTCLCQTISWTNVDFTVRPLTHWGRDKLATVFQTTFSNTLSWMKMYEFRLRFHWSLFVKVQPTIFHRWFRKWLVAWLAPSHYLNQWWLVYWRIYASLGLNELRTNFIEKLRQNILISFKRMHFNMSVKCWLFCSGFNELR